MTISNSISQPALTHPSLHHLNTPPPPVFTQCSRVNHVASLMFCVCAGTVLRGEGKREPPAAFGLPSMQPPPLPPSKVGAGQRSSFGIAGLRAFPGSDGTHQSPLRETAAAPQPRGVDTNTLRSLAFLDDGDEDVGSGGAPTVDVAGPSGAVQATPPRPKPPASTQRVFSSGVHSPGPSGGSGAGGARRPGDVAGHSPASSPVERFQVARNSGGTAMLFRVVEPFAFVVCQCG